MALKQQHTIQRIPSQTKQKPLTKQQLYTKNQYEESNQNSQNMQHQKPAAQQISSTATTQQIQKPSKRTAALQTGNTPIMTKEFIDYRGFNFSFSLPYNPSAYFPFNMKQNLLFRPRIIVILQIISARKEIIKTINPIA